MGTWTNNGLNLVATAVQTPGAQAGMSYVGISPGCGVLFTPLVSGTPTTQLVVVGSPPALSIGQALTITDGTNVANAVVSGGLTGSGGNTTIPVTSFTPANNFAASTTVVAPTPAATDTVLYNETQRTGVAGSSAGAGAGESLVSGYFDGTQPTGIYYLVGWFGGATATSTPGTGTLMGEDLVYWSHVANSDTNMYQAGCTI